MIHVTDANTLTLSKDSIKIEEVLLSADTAGRTSKEAAEAIGQSLRGKLTGVGQITLSGIASESGGGGTGDSIDQGRINEVYADENTRFMPCCLHNVQTLLRNVVEELFGKGG